MTLDDTPIELFSEDQINYIQGFERLRTSTNELEEAISTLSGIYDSLLDRIEHYVQEEHLPILYEDVMSSPVDSSSILLSTFSFSHVTPQDSFMGNNLQSKIPTLYDIEYPNTTTPVYVMVNNGVATTSSSLLLENVIDLSPYGIKDDISFLYNNNGSLSFSPNIPLNKIYSTTSFSGLPPGTIVRWNGNASLDSSTFFPPSIPWSYPTTSTDTNQFSFPYPYLGYLTGSQTRGSNATISISYIRASGSGSVNYPNCYGYTYFFDKIGSTSCIMTYVTSSSADGWYYNSYHGKNALRFPPGVSVTLMFNTDKTSWFTKHPNEGMLFETSIKLTSFPTSIPANSVMTIPYVFSIMCYENWGEELFQLGFEVSCPSGVMTYNYFIYSYKYFAKTYFRVNAAELGNWVDITILSQDGKLKIFKNNVEVAQTTVYGNVVSTSYTKYATIGGRVYDSPSYWTGDVYIASGMIINFGNKNVYEVDWNKTNNVLYKSHDKFKGMECNAEHVVPKVQYSELYEVLGDTYSTPTDIAAGNFRIPINMTGLHIKGFDTSDPNYNLHSNAGGNTSTKLLGAKWNYTVQSHNHPLTCIVPQYSSGPTTGTLNVNAGNLGGPSSIVTGTGANINSTYTLSLAAGNNIAVTPNISKRYILLTGK